MHYALLIALTYQSFDSAHDDSTILQPAIALSPCSPLSNPFLTRINPLCRGLNYGSEKLQQSINKNLHRFHFEIITTRLPYFAE